jgi:hypothetical protein
MVFKREVTAVDRVKLDLRHVRGRLHAGAREERVVHAGGDHHLTLVRFEELPRIGNRLPVGLDVVEDADRGSALGNRASGRSMATRRTAKFDPLLPFTEPLPRGVP